MKDIEVKRIESKESYDFLLNKHYAGRIPSISYAFGLYINNVIEGVLTIGKPASNSLCKGVCGIEYSNKVYELNRLVVNDGLERNTLSFFVICRFIVILHLFVSTSIILHRILFFKYNFYIF